MRFQTKSRSPGKIKHSRQRGVVLLSLMLIVMAAASFLLLKGLNEHARNISGVNGTNTRAVLKEAKASLIGYALSYPEKHSGAKGPGRLPCPDYHYVTGGSDNIGQSDSCSLGSGTETGLFPFHTIDANEMFDGSGSRLWYAVSDNHRANAGGVVNSDTEGTLSVDDLHDVVAVIIAPGAALEGQNRNTSDPTELYNASHYLEAENASTGDNLFTNITNNYVNDQMITITRAELMSVVENRVLNTVSKAMNRYFEDPDEDDISGVDPDCAVSEPECDNAYPWLSPFGNPSLSDFASSPGTREGHLPVVANGRPFSTSLNFNWDVPADGTVSGTSSFDPDGNCARKAECRVEGSTMTQLPIGDAGATCTWAGTRSLNCSTVEIINLTGGDRLEREYVFEFDGIPMTADAPTATTRRTLDYELNSGERLPESVTLARITLTDNKVLLGGGSVASESVSLTLEKGAAVESLLLRDIAFDIEIDHDDVIYPQAASGNASASPGELPEWFFEDEWHHLIVLSYAQAEQPADLNENCTIDGSCLKVEWDRHGNRPDTEIEDVRAVVVIAGPDLNAARPSASLTDYFEGENASSGDTVFARSEGLANFNDQIKVLDPDD